MPRYGEIINAGDAFGQGFEDYLTRLRQRQHQDLLDQITIKREERLAKSEEMDMQDRQEVLKQRKADAFVKHYQNTHVKGDIPDAATVQQARELGVDWIFKQEAPIAGPPSQSMELPGAVQPGGPPPPGMKQDSGFLVRPPAGVVPPSDTGIGVMPPPGAVNQDPGMLIRPPGVPIGSANLEEAAPAAPPPGSVRIGPGPREQGVPGRTEYQGSAKEQDLADKRAAVEEYVKGLDPNDPDRRAINFWLQTGMMPPASTKAGKGQTKRILVFHPDTGKSDWLEVPGSPDGTVDSSTVVERTNPAAANTPQVFLRADGSLDLDATAKAGGFTPQSALMQAVDLAERGEKPTLGRTKEGAPMYRALVNIMPELEKTDKGWMFQGQPVNVRSLAVAQSDFKADQNSQKNIQANLDSAEAFQRTADANSDLLETALKDIPDTGMAWLNKPVRSAVEAFGSKAMAGFDAIIRSVNNEYARLNTQANINSGVLTDAARKEFEKILNPNATAEQIKESLRVLQLEGNNRVKSYKEQLELIRGRITPNPEQRGPKAPQDQVPKEDPNKVMDDIVNSLRKK